MVDQPKCECGATIGCSVHDNRWWCSDCLWTEVDRLQAIVNKLAKRPDGVTLAPGDEAWIVPGTRWRSGQAWCVTEHAARLRIVSVGVDWVCGVLSAGLQPVVPASRLAGTQEAAEAALETEQQQRT